MRLPSELRYRLLDYLDLEDSMNLRHVSRSWRSAFTDPEFCLEILKRHFREKFEADYRTLHSLYRGKDLKVQEDQTMNKLKVWLEDYAVRRLHRIRGHYHSMAIYYNETIDIGTYEVTAEPQYSNARIALCKDNKRTLVVRCLRSGTQERFATEGRHVFDQWTLSDKYLVATEYGGQ